MRQRYLKLRSNRGQFCRRGGPAAARRGMMTLEVVILVAISAAIASGLYWLWAKAPLNGEAGGILKQLSLIVGELFKTINDNGPTVY